MPPSLRPADPAASGSAHCLDDALRQRAARVVPGGMTGHLSAARLPAGYPQFFERGRGCRLWDVDGREFIDFMCSWGPNLLGHHHPEVEAAAARQAALAGFEAIALARQAAATAALGQLQPEPTRPGERASLASAAELAERAVALVGHLRYLDGSVEEVLLACAEVFVRCGARDQAAHVRERGRQGVLRKLRGIVDP